MERAVLGGKVTTTGGRGDLDLSAPGLAVPDGDDIVVIPDAPASPSRGRMRAFLVGAIVLVLAAAGITIALVNRDDSGTTRVSSIAKRAPTPTIKPSTKRVVAKKPHKVPSRPRASVPIPVVVTTIPVNVGGGAPAGPPPVTPTLPVAPPTTPSYPPSMLTWQTSPAALTIKAGGHAVVSVTVTNPTDGTVTLGQPLSCPPALKPNNGGAAIAGGGVCEQMAQVMSPHQTLTRQYTIYATDSADASGAPLAPGRYTATFENLHAITVTVTAS